MTVVEQGSAAGRGSGIHASEFADLASSVRSRLLGIIAIGLLIVAAGAAIGFGRGLAPPMIALLPILVGAAVITDLMSAYILFAEVVQTRAASLALIATGYLIAATLAIPYLGLFPGIFLTGARFASLGQASLHLWVLWHTSFPTCIVLAMLVERSRRSRIRHGQERWTVAILSTSCLAVAGVSADLVLRAVHLPTLVSNGHFTTVTTHGILPLLLALNVIALALVWDNTRFRSSLGLWLAVALVASALDASMGLLVDRWSYGWWIGKLFMVTSSSVMLGAFVHELSQQKGQLLSINGALTNSQRKLTKVQVLFDLTNDIILFIDRKTFRFLEVNDAALKAYGRTRPALLSMGLADIHESGWHFPESLSAEDLEAGVLFESTHRNSDDQLFPVEILARTCVIEDQTIIVATVRRIAERIQARHELSRALEQALESSRLKSEFVATMSHEIRTPMNGVIGMTDMLLRSELRHDQRECAEIVRDSARSLLTVVNDILDFSKIEAGKIDLELVRFSPTDVLRGVVALLQTAADAKRTVLDAHVDRDVPATVNGDPTRLRQVLVNLVGNAIKFTDRGSIRVTLALETAVAPGIRLRFTITDTGIGISPEVRERLFKAFVQGDGSTTRRFGGTGLGLTISRRFVELMGGEVTFEPNPAGGSIFTFTVLMRDEPVSREAAIRPGASADDAVGLGHPVRPERLSTARLLVAEDQPVNRRVLTLQLTELGYTFASVSNGREAVDLVARETFDLILMDVHMPVMDGLLATRAIRQTERDSSRRVVIIALTASPQDEGRRACMEAGMDDHLTKPLDFECLREKLEHWLPRSESGTLKTG